MHRKHLKDNGVKILSAMENIPETPEGILLESLLEGYEHSNGHNKKSNMDWGGLHSAINQKRSSRKRIPRFH